MPIKILRKRAEEDNLREQMILLSFFEKTLIPTDSSYRLKALKCHSYRFDHKILCPTDILDTPKKENVE
jgi:hypothetical protein